MRLKTIVCMMMVLSLVSLARPGFADDAFDIEINKGRMIKLSKPAASVVVADPTTADVQVVSPSLLFVHGKKVGDTSIYAIDALDNPIYSATVTVTHNLSKLESAIKRVAPNATTNVQTVDGGIILEGLAGSVEESENIRNITQSFLGTNEKMINMMKSGGSDQVSLKVKIVEMSRNDLKKFGINLQNIASNGLFAMQLLQGNNILFNTANKDVQAFSTFGAPLYRGASTDSNVMLRYKDVAGVIDALETNGLASILAEPVLTTTSGSTANFLAGGEFPLPTVGANNAVTIDYKKFGVSLDFTPTVLSKDRISITVAPEVSSLNFSNPIQVSGITYPILETRKAKSTVELGSGDTFMLAGLLKNESGNNVSKFPGLGDLPVLGTLFRSTSFQNNQTELVILVTPYLVHPISEAKKAQTPVDGYVPPNDFQRLLMGSLYQQQPMDKEKPLPKLNGESGFIYE